MADGVAPGVGAEGEEALAGKNKGIDYAQLEKGIEQHCMLAKQGKVQEAVEALLGLEKNMRLAADVRGTRRVVLAIVGVCREAGEWKMLNDQVLALSKKRAQLKQAVAAMIQEAMGYIDSTPDKATRVQLIRTLSNVAAGKIYAEVERARLVKMLARIKEDEGNIKEAADILQEVAVETFGAMAKTEKIAFILEQVRLCLDNGDFMRAQILSKKINPRVFASKDGSVKEVRKKGGEEGKEEGEGAEGEKEGARKEKPKLDKEAREKEGDEVVHAAAPDVPSLPQLKLRYYHLMIRYYAHSREYLEICRCYVSIFETPSAMDDPAAWMPVLTKICWYLVLAPHHPMQSSLLHSTAANKKLSDLPQLKALLKKFITMEVIPWDAFAAEYAVEMAAEKDIFGEAQATQDLRLRVTEHNILVVSKYYSRVTMHRLAQLLGLSLELSEQHLSSMVVAKALQAKIDRPSGIVTFRSGLSHTGLEVLDQWGSSISRLLGLVESSCHQIHKEAMVHKVVLKG